MADWEKKVGKTNIQKFEYLEKEKSFLDEIKKIFIAFEDLSLLSVIVKKKNPSI